MNIIVVNGHPDKKSFCKAITDQYVNSLDDTQHKVTVFHLCELDFDPVLRYGYRKRMAPDEVIERSQEALMQADHLVFIYPVWWSSVPSLLKGWIDRVFTPGIAYSSNNKGSFIANFLTGKQFKKRLKGKTSEIIVTSMAPNWWYRIFSGYLNVPDSYGVSVIKNAVFNHCGIKNKKVMVLGNMGREQNDEKVRKTFLMKVKKRAESIK